MEEKNHLKNLNFASIQSDGKICWLSIGEIGANINSCMFSLFFIGGLTYLFVKFILKENYTTSKGQAGENLVRRYIEKLAEYEGYKISPIHDLYIPKSDSTTSQIDHVMVTDKGIFVIEMKNYEGGFRK
ncbi:MAG: nuclease-related domain-containing protein [Anaerobacillus sp.]